MNSESIISTLILGINNTGERIDINLSLGQPYLESSNDEFEQWRCPVAIFPLYKRLADAPGENALQALCVAISLMFTLLSGFKEKGGKLLNSDGTEFDFNPYSINLVGAYGLGVKATLDH